ncbi:MAG: metalloregulator ArsR/SmtB family transcription factor [Rhodospirillales bacterium]
METNDVITALAALAQETRLAVFRRLVVAGQGGMPAGLLADELSVVPATLSFHLKELAHAGLVTSERQGRSIVYQAAFGCMDGVIGYLTLNCCRDDRRLMEDRDETSACCPVGQ